MAFDAGLADRIRRLLPGTGAVEERKMFGGLAFMMNDHMFCGIVKADLMLRLGAEESAAALGQPHTRPMDFSGKPMKSMVYVSAAGLDSDESLQAWVESALNYVSTLGPKKTARKGARSKRPVTQHARSGPSASRKHQTKPRN